MDEHLHPSRRLAGHRGSPNATHTVRSATAKVNVEARTRLTANPPPDPEVGSRNRRPRRPCSHEVGGALRCFAPSTAAPASLKVGTALAPPEAASGGTTGRNPRPPPGGGSPYLSEEGRPTRPPPSPRASASASHSRPRGCRFQLLVSAPAGPNARPALPRQAGVCGRSAKEAGLGPEARPPLPDQDAPTSLPAATAAPTSRVRPDALR